MWKLYRAVCSWLPLLKGDSDDTNRSDVVRCDCGCAWQDFWLGCAAHCSWNQGGNHLAVGEIFWFSGKLCILVQWYLDIGLEDLDQPARKGQAQRMLFGIWLTACCFLSVLSAGWEVSWLSELPPLENLITRALQFSLRRWQNELICLYIQTWCLTCLASSWTPQSPYSLWVSSWIYWDLSFPELPCMELLLVTPGRATHFSESYPKSVLDVLLNFQGWILPKPMEVQLHIRLCCFLFFCIVQGLLFLERFFFLAVPKPLCGACCSFNLLLGFPIPF